MRELYYVAALPGNGCPSTLGDAAARLAKALVDQFTARVTPAYRDIFDLDDTFDAARLAEPCSARTRPADDVLVEKLEGKSRLADLEKLVGPAGPDDPVYAAAAAAAAAELDEIERTSVFMAGARD